jgi:thiol-disulfide isomerase/thioredoxin
MKKLVACLPVLAFISCSVQNKVATPSAEIRTYEVSQDSESKILKGYINRALIENDTSFKWFQQNMKYGTADANAVQTLQKNAGNLHFIVFGGTWCHDTQNLLPVFYRLTDKSSVADSLVTLIGVDRAKTALNSLHTAFHITNVPTFIVMKDGKEIGRVVEYGKYGAIDKEIGEIVAGTTGK